MNETEMVWLHPDGKVGGRADDGALRWFHGPVIGAWVDDGGTVTRPSPHAVEAPCPHSADCGGCDLDSWAPAARAEALRHMVARAYQTEPPPLLSGVSLGSRARISLSLVGGRPGYRAPRSHRHVPIDACATARPEVQEALARLLQVEIDEGYDRVEIRGDGERAVFAFERAKAATRGKPPRLPIPDLDDVAIDGRPARGDPTLWLTVAGSRLRASPASFYQVNLELNEALVTFVRDELMQRRPERLLDLYAGIGNFTLPMAATGMPVEAVEIEGQATADLVASAAGDPRVKVQTQRVEAFDPSRCAFDAVILDPPRAGAGPVIDRVLRSRPKVVVHVACDPVAGARDVRRAQQAGYRLTTLRCFDLFPNTRHVETVAVLERG